MTAEVAPGQKVGFCLEDTQGREANGPATGVYQNLDFCHQGNPTASSIAMGISPGWRDRYGANLAMQWVDVSDTPPGAYRLAAEIDPQNIIAEADETNNQRAFAAGETIIPGYRALPVNAGTLPGAAASSIALRSQAFGSPGARRFRIVTLPANGVLREGSTTLAVGSTVTGDTVTYTPGGGASGADGFTYAAVDSTSQFPRTPAAASVTFTVGQAPAQTTVAISGAPASLDMGTGAQLTATVLNGEAGVAWSVNGVAGGNAAVGTVSATGLYQAPAAVPPGGTVTVRATSTAAPSAYDEVQIRITNPGPPDPAPNPGTNHVANGSFEAGTSGWGTWNAALTREQAADAPAGVWVARVARTGGTSFTLDDSPMSVTSAQAASAYTGRAFARAGSASSVGKGVRVYLRERAASGAVVRTVYGPVVTLTNAFQPITAELTARSAGNQIEIYIGQLGATTGDAFLVDGISLTNGQGGPPVNEPPTASFGANTLNPHVGQEVVFADHSTDQDGSVAARAWDTDGDGQFDDGTATTATATYAVAGQVTVRLRVTDNAGATATAARTVTVTAQPPANEPPSASFTAAPADPRVGEDVTFTDTSTDADGSITAREWDLDADGLFDDGTGATATRAFPDATPVTVRLRVTDDAGATTIAARTVAATTGPAPGGPNLVVNGSFEASVAGWTTWQASLLREQVPGSPAGAWAVKVTRTAGTSFTIDDSPTSVVSVPASVPYRATAAVRAATASAIGKPVQIFLRERTASGAVVRNVAGPAVPLTTAFQTVTAELTPAVGNQVEIYLGQKSAVAGDAFHVDDVQLRAVG